MDQNPAQPNQPAAPAPAEQSAPATPAESQPAGVTPAPEPTPAPAQPAAPTASVTPPTPAAPTPPASAPTVPSTPPTSGAAPMKKGGMKPLMIALLVILLVAIGGGVYVFGMNKSLLPHSQPKAMPTPTPILMTSPTPASAMSPTASPSGAVAGGGTVSGRLCYPASVVPPGTIYAKNLATGKEYTKAYAGTGAGAATTYTLPLPAGTYHMKFTPESPSNLSGYYTEYSTCVDTPGEPNCSGNATRSILPVNVTAGQTVVKVNLCDYYYEPTKPPQY